jgi:hypothetical protein
LVFTSVFDTNNRSNLCGQQILLSDCGLKYRLILSIPLSFSLHPRIALIIKIKRRKKKKAKIDSNSNNKVS